MISVTSGAGVGVRIDGSMPETSPVNQSRLAAGLALGVLVALVAAPSAEIEEGALVLGVQPDAYRLFAPHPQRDRAADTYVPRHGLMAVGVRLEADGCEAPPCAAWHVLGWITTQPDLSIVSR